MQPEIQIGSLAVVSPVQVELLSAGDIIVYLQARNLTLSRSSACECR